MKIAIIDSGVDKKNKMLKDVPIFGCSLRVINEQIEIDNDFTDVLGHGTAIFYLVNKFTDGDEIFNFKIFFDNIDLNMHDLNLILEYIYSNYNFDIINISFGTLYSNKLEELQIICNKLFHKGTFIVAAYDNYGAMSYPACCNYVFGVSAEDMAQKEIKIQEGFNC